MQNLLRLQNPLHNQPLAAYGLTSYRYPSAWSKSWIMIGAQDHADAISEANRSLEIKNASLDKLQIWDGSAYVPALIAAGCTMAQPEPELQTA